MKQGPFWCCVPSRWNEYVQEPTKRQKYQGPLSASFPVTFLQNLCFCPHNTKFCWIMGCDSQQGRISTKKAMKFYVLEAVTTSRSHGASLASKPTDKEKSYHMSRITVSD